MTVREEIKLKSRLTHKKKINLCGKITALDPHKIEKKHEHSVYHLVHC